jgi:hypothetical protein
VTIRSELAMKGEVKEAYKKPRERIKMMEILVRGFIYRF